jgi:phosphoglycolate phosphatase-like HAD superfamily hydrolase
MVGDAMTDLLGAREAGARFVGRVRPGDPDPFATQSVPVVSDLAELDRRWVELLG